MWAGVSGPKFKAQLWKISDEPAAFPALSCCFFMAVMHPGVKHVFSRPEVLTLPLMAEALGGTSHHLCLVLQ